jgi:3-oxoacyl-[acyl-carrier protein] reductase
VNSGIQIRGAGGPHRGIDTDMIRGNPAITADLIPVGRFGGVSEVASVALLLASNGYMTGQTINVNGGWYMS